MRDRLLAACIALTLACAPSAHAGALSFTFSFSNVTGTVPGTVTGEITGLTDNGTSSATSVTIDSYPAALGLSLSVPFETIADSALNSFTVANGDITSGYYFAVGVGSYAFGINHIGGNYLENASGPELFNGDGLGGVSFTAVPENSTWAMLLLGFAGLGIVRLRPRPKAA